MVIRKNEMAFGFDKKVNTTVVKMSSLGHIFLGMAITPCPFQRNIYMFSWMIPRLQISIYTFSESFYIIQRYASSLAKIAILRNLSKCF